MAQKDIDVQANGTHASAPSPAEGFEVLLITGMSGAGRSHAADSIEDMGWYVVDNMPPKLLVPLVDMMTRDPIFTNSPLLSTCVPATISMTCPRCSAIWTILV